MNEGTGTRIGLGLAAGACLLALLAMDGESIKYPPNADGLCDAPAPNTCYSPPTTLVPATDPSAVPSSTAAPVVDPSVTSPETTAAPAPRPNSEAAPKETPPTEPPAPQPDRVNETTATTVGVAPSSCNRTSTVRSGDTWVTIADRGDVWTRDLLALNGATKATPLIVGMSVCLPPSVYGDQGPPATTAPQTTPATEAPTVPPTPAPRPASEASATQPPATQAPAPSTTRQPPTTKPRNTTPPATAPPTAPPTAAPKQGQDTPKKPQTAGTNAPKPAPTTVPCQTC